MFLFIFYNILITNSQVSAKGYNLLGPVVAFETTITIDVTISTEHTSKLHQSHNSLDLYPNALGTATPSSRTAGYILILELINVKGKAHTCIEHHLMAASESAVSARGPIGIVR